MKFQFRGPLGGQSLNSGGSVDMDDPTNRDSVPAMLTPGEFVVNKEAVAMFGPQIKAMNEKGLQSRHQGNQQAQVKNGVLHANPGAWVPDLSKLHEFVAGKNVTPGAPGVGDLVKGAAQGLGLINYEEDEDYDSSGWQPPAANTTNVVPSVPVATQEKVAPIVPAPVNVTGSDNYTDTTEDLGTVPVIPQQPVGNLNRVGEIPGERAAYQQSQATSESTWRDPATGRTWPVKIDDNGNVYVADVNQPTGKAASAISKRFFQSQSSQKIDEAEEKIAEKVKEVEVEAQVELKTTGVLSDDTKVKLKEIKSAEHIIKSNKAEKNKVEQLDEKKAIKQENKDYEKFTKEVKSVGGDVIPKEEWKEKFNPPEPIARPENLDTTVTDIPVPKGRPDDLNTVGDIPVPEMRPADLIKDQDVISEFPDVKMKPDNFGDIVLEHKNGQKMAITDDVMSKLKDIFSTVEEYTGFSSKDFSRFAMMYLGGRLTGGSHEGSLRVAAKEGLRYSDSRKAAQSENLKSYRTLAAELRKDGTLSTEGYKKALKAIQSGDVVAIEEAMSDTKNYSEKAQLGIPAKEKTVKIVKKGYTNPVEAYKNPNGQGWYVKGANGWAAVAAEDYRNYSTDQDHIKDTNEFLRSNTKDIFKGNVDSKGQPMPSPSNHQIVSALTKFGKKQGKLGRPDDPREYIPYVQRAVEWQHKTGKPMTAEGLEIFLDTMVVGGDSFSDTTKLQDAKGNIVSAPKVKSFTDDLKAFAQGKEEVTPTSVLRKADRNFDTAKHTKDSLLKGVSKDSPYYKKINDAPNDYWAFVYRGLYNSN